jgi:hypothetical protein
MSTAASPDTPGTGPAAASDDSPRIPQEALDQLAPLAQCADAYQAELAASAILGGVYAGAVPGDRVLVIDQYSEELVKLLATSPARQALVALAGLASLTSDRVAEQCRAAVTRILAQTPDAPEWILQTGRVECTGAWAMRDLYGDITQYLVSFEYSAGPVRGGPEHLICVRLDNNLQVIFEAEVAAPGRQFVEQAKAAGAAGQVAIEEIDPAVVRADVGEAFGRTDELPHPPGGTGYVNAWALVAARVASLPGTAPSSRPLPLADYARDELTQAFAASPEGRIDSPQGHLPSDLVARVARQAIDFAVDLNSGDPLRWSPVSARIMLVNWFPQRDDVEPEIAAWLPEILAGFVSYAGRVKQLPPEAIELTRRAIEATSAEYGQLMFGDGTPDQNAEQPAESARQVMARMRADGVDPTDDERAREWLTAYYARQP